MDEVITQIRALREQLALLEAGLAGGPRPERLAWLELDAAGAITRVSALALERLGLGADIAAGTPLGMLADTKGDVLVDGVLVLTTAAGPITALSVGDGAGRTIVLGGSNTDAAGDIGARPLRQLVHDMSNVIGIMRGRAELTAMQSDDDSVLRSMTEIQKAADRAMAMLDEHFPPPDLD